MSIHQSLREQLRPWAERARMGPSRIRRVVQVTAFLDGEAEPAASHGRHETLRWLHRRAGPLPNHAWQGESFEREVAPGHVASAIALAEPAPYWVTRLDHPDTGVAGRTWSTEVSIGVSPKGAQFGVRLTCVSRGEDPEIELSTPGIVRQLAEQIGLRDYLDVRLAPAPWLLQTNDDVHGLVALIEHDGRTRPVYVISLPDGQSDPASALIDGTRLAQRCLGVAHVSILPSPLSFHLTDLVGKEHSVFSGAVRSYMPGFAVEDQVPRKHPLALPVRILEWASGDASAFEGLLIQRAFEHSVRSPDLERRLPSFTLVRKLALSRRQADLERDGDQVQMIANLQAQTAELSREAETWEALASEESERRIAVAEEFHQLRAENEWMRFELDRLRADVQHISGGRADAPVAIPDNLSRVADWAHAVVPGRLIILPRAIRAAKKGQYRDIGHVFDALLLLANEYRDLNHYRLTPVGLVA